MQYDSIGVLNNSLAYSSIIIVPCLLKSVYIFFVKVVSDLVEKSKPIDHK